MLYYLTRFIKIAHPITRESRQERILVDQSKGGKSLQRSNHDNKDDHKNDHTTVYSSRSTSHDYLTLRGIKLRTQITGKEIYTTCLGEIMDNSIDDMETHGVKDPQVKVIISISLLSEEKSLVTIVVRNSVNPSTNHVFSKQHLELIYSFKTYYSSKRFYKISRGALGDASKLMQGAPYALADSMNIDLRDSGIAHPIIHKTSANGTLKTFHIGLSSTATAEHEVIEDEEIPSIENYTEVQIVLPCNKADSKRIELELVSYLRDYSFLNPHIGFTFNFPSSDRSIHLPATQPMINSGKNLSDIRFYNLSEFRQAIKELHDKKQTIYDVLLKNFRGANNLPKNDLTLATIEELEKSPSKMEELFELMRNKISQISSEKRQASMIPLASMIPFATTKKTRRRALEERLVQYGISCDRVKYKQKYDYYKSDDGTQYPFFLRFLLAIAEGALKIISKWCNRLTQKYLMTIWCLMDRIGMKLIV
jgi:hypothetical protein